MKNIDNSSMTIDISYAISDEQVELMKYELSPANFDFASTAGYKAGAAAIAKVRTTRTAIEERRKELKKVPLEIGRKIDGEAAKWTAILAQIEEPLKQARKVVDDAKAEEKRVKEEEERRKIEDAIRIKREAEEAAAKAIRDAEEARLKVEREAFEKQKAADAAAKAKSDEEARVAREQFESEKREALAKIDAERRAVEAETARLKAEKDAKELAERLAKEADEKRIADAERAAALKAREEALKPDKAKLATLAEALLYYPWPEVKAKEAKEALSKLTSAVTSAATELVRFAKATGAQ